MYDITVRDFIEAIRKNGLPQIFGAMYEKDKEEYEIIAACAVGQANLNLGINTPPSGTWYEATIKGQMLISTTVSLNDNDRLPFDKIADKLTEIYVDVLDVFAFYQKGTLINA